MLILEFKLQVQKFCSFHQNCLPASILQEKHLNIRDQILELVNRTHPIVLSPSLKNLSVPPPPPPIHLINNHFWESQIYAIC